LAHNPSGDEKHQLLEARFKLDPGNKEYMEGYLSSFTPATTSQDTRLAVLSRYSEVVGKDKMSLENKLKLAEAHRLKGEDENIEKAIVLYRNILGTDKDNIKAREGYVRCLIAQGYVAWAKEIIEDAGDKFGADVKSELQQAAANGTVEVAYQQEAEDESILFTNRVDGLIADVGEALAKSSPISLDKIEAYTTRLATLANNDANKKKLVEVAKRLFNRAYENLQTGRTRISLNSNSVAAASSVQNSKWVLPLTKLFNTFGATICTQEQQIYYLEAAKRYDELAELLEPTLEGGDDDKLGEYTRILVAGDLQARLFLLDADKVPQTYKPQYLAAGKTLLAQIKDIAKNDSSSETSPLMPRVIEKLLQQEEGANIYTLRKALFRLTPTNANNNTELKNLLRGTRKWKELVDTFPRDYDSSEAPERKLAKAQELLEAKKYKDAAVILKPFAENTGATESTGAAENKDSIYQSFARDKYLYCLQELGYFRARDSFKSKYLLPMPDIPYTALNDPQNGKTEELNFWNPTEAEKTARIKEINTLLVQTQDESIKQAFEAERVELGYKAPVEDEPAADSTSTPKKQGFFSKLFGLGKE